jgi:hypothetical protein
METTMRSPQFDRTIRLSTGHLSDASVAFLSKPPTDRVGEMAEDRPSSEDGLFRDRMPDRGGRHHRWLELGGESLWCIPHRFGWLVWVPGELCSPDSDEVPADLVAIIERAQRDNCDWINFDCDETPLEDLPTFESA